MKKPNTQTIIGILLILFLILLGTLFIRLMKKNSECVENPFIYGAQKTAEQGMEVRCSCTPLDNRFTGFYFDKESLVIQKDFVQGINLNP